MAVVKIIEGLLSKRLATSIIFLLSVSARLIQVVFFYNPRVDASYQLMAAKNLIAGQGVSLDTVSAADLSHVINTPLINWPPGYSFLVSPFMELTGNYMIGAILLDVIMALVFMVVSVKILKLLEVPLYLRNLAFLLMGFYIYFFYFIASSDAIAIPFFLAGLYLFLKMIRYGKIKAWNIGWMVVFLFLFASVKYLFMPVALIIPAIIVVLGWREPDKKLLRAGLVSFFLLASGIGFILICQKLVSGSATYISQPERAFFPEHLLEAYPFIPASFLKPETLIELLPAGQGWIRHLYLVVHILLSILLTIFMVKSFRSRKPNERILTSLFYFITWSVSLCITVLLAFLSLRVAKEEILPGWFWTYIEEPRYYGLAIVLIQLSVFVFASKSIYKREGRGFWLSIILLILFLPEIARGSYFTINRIGKFNTEEYSWQYEDRFQKYAGQLIDNFKHPGQLAVVTGSSYYMNHRVNLYSKIPILDSSLVINNLSSLQTSHSVLLLVILQEKNLASYKKFIDSVGQKEAGRFEDYHFYILHVNAR